ncbi:hypothetical protein H8S10_13750 [Clostridium sp. NSJ-49]|jgi:hypothetical protein|uniref:Uncharacterized protein n=1 Tax=Clostridium disporicum TaxID=84024 RepID=A0A174KIR0_9CLOT|nr:MULTISPECIES: hypothetical protein [Clostridium]MBC5626520.1 hypothetical protein [Clostridium sp. NSJ-49]MDU6341501.1 hypothetical protein [Clostridium sp.]CUP09688.1 Uncharacterised protein [Clostridium disporicum]
MAHEKLEKKINGLMKVIKKGRMTEEIADEVSNVIDEIEDLGDAVKKNFSSSLNEMKKALKKMK